MGNLTKFLEDYTDYINKRIPNPDFDGIAVLDFEEWRPLYDMNFASGKLGIIQEESKNVVKGEHPEWSEDEIAAYAEEDFDRAARYIKKILSIKIGHLKSSSCIMLRPSIGLVLTERKHNC